MKGIFSRRPSPALVLSAIALFLAMGGVSYGLATGSVDSREIRNNTIRSGDVRNRAIRGRDVKNDTITGRQVLERKLRTVPDAAGLAGVRAVRLPAFTLTNGQTRELLRQGPLTFNARCVIGAPNAASIEVDTSADNAAVQGQDNDADFDAADAPLDAVRANGDPGFDQEAAGVAIAPGGVEVFYRNLYAGVNVVGDSARCRFGGVFGIG
jgi:hypothetical protein